MDTSGSFARMVPDEPYPGVERRSFSTDESTVTAYAFEPGAVFPRHRHPQEQVTLVQRGLVEFTVGTEVQEMGPGGWSVVGPGVEHGLKAGPDGAEIIAIIVPRRESVDAYEAVAPLESPA